jgi:hypothetical protein
LRSGIAVAAVAGDPPAYEAITVRVEFVINGTAQARLRNGLLRALAHMWSIGWSGLALRVLLLAGYSGPPLTLYRGTSNHERRRRLYRFSWSTDATIARRFAEHWAQSLLASYTGVTFEGVVLQAVVPRRSSPAGPAAGGFLRRRRSRRVSTTRSSYLVSPRRRAAMLSAMRSSS